MPSDFEGKAPPDLGRGILVFALVLVLETIAIGTGYFFLARNVAVRETEKAALLAKITESETKAKAEESAAKDAAAYRSQMAAAKAALDEHVYWTTFFAFLESRTRPTVQYINFSGDADSGAVTLDANAKTYRDFAEQILVFRDDPLVTSVRTSSAAADVDEAGNVNGVNFTLVVTFKKEAFGPKKADAAATASAPAATPAGEPARCGILNATEPYPACIIEKIATCAPATIGRIGAGGSGVVVEIKGMKDGKCALERTSTDAATNATETRACTLPEGSSPAAGLDAVFAGTACAPR